MNKKIVATLLGVMMLGATGCSNNDNNKIEQQGQKAEIAEAKEDIVTALPKYIKQADNIYKYISSNYSTQSANYNAQDWENCKQQVLKDIDALKVPSVNMTEAQTKLPENLKNYLNVVDALLTSTVDYKTVTEAEEAVRVPLSYAPRIQKVENNTNVTASTTNISQTNKNSNQLDKATYLAKCQELYNEVRNMYNQQKDNFIPSEWASFMRDVNAKSNELRDNNLEKELSMDQITLANDIRQLASDYGKILQGRGNWDKINEYITRIENAINDINQE